MINEMHDYSIAENEPLTSAYNTLVQRREYLIGRFNALYSRQGDGTYQIHLQIMDIEKYIEDVFPKHQTGAAR